MAIVTVLAVQSVIAIVTVLAIETDIYGYCDPIVLKTNIHLSGIKSGIKCMELVPGEIL